MTDVLREREMQKWEYMTLYLEYGSNFKSRVDPVVMYVNGEKVGDIKFMMFSDTEVTGTRLHEFLNQAGERGWELVIYSRGNVVLKRPKATDDSPPVEDAE